MGSRRLGGQGAQPDVRAITERSTEEIAEVLRLTHDEGRNRRAIVDKSGELILQRAAQRAGHQVGQRLPFHPQVDWVSALARSQASVITEVSNACTKTARDLLK